MKYIILLGFVLLLINPVSGLLLSYNNAPPSENTYATTNLTIIVQNVTGGGLVNETDPVFTAWDKSTGINITESQITDLQSYILTESDPVFTAWNKSSGISITESQITDLQSYILTESDPVFTAWNKSSGISITESQISDLQSYLLSESDPVFTAWDKSTGISITESQISDLKSYLTSSINGNVNISGILNIGGGYSSGGISLYDSGNLYMDGDLLLGGNFLTVSSTLVNGSFYPDVTNVYTLGNNSLRWDGLYTNDIWLGDNTTGAINFYHADEYDKESISWDFANDRFLFTDDIYTAGNDIITLGTLNGGILSVTSYIHNFGYFKNDEDIYTTGPGDDLWLGTTTQNSSLLRAYANGELYAQNIFENGITLSSKYLQEVPSGIITNASNGNTAHGWGNHANVGYLTTVPSDYKKLNQNLNTTNSPTFDELTLTKDAGSGSTLQSVINFDNGAIQQNSTHLCIVGNNGGGKICVEYS